MKKTLIAVAAAGFAAIASAAEINLKDVKSNITLTNGDVATGSLSGKHQISIAAGASVTLRNVTIAGGGTAECKKPAISWPVSVE